MACCSWSYQRTAKPNSPAAVAVSPSSCHSTSHSHLLVSSSSICSSPSLSLTVHCDETLIRSRLSRRPSRFPIVSLSNKPEPLKVMISGAPASGKGTQCQLIIKKCFLLHQEIAPYEIAPSRKTD